MAYTSEQIKDAKEYGRAIEHLTACAISLYLRTSLEYEKGNIDLKIVGDARIQLLFAIGVVMGDNVRERLSKSLPLPRPDIFKVEAKEL